MARFLYFIEKLSGSPGPKQLVQRGLGYAFPRGTSVSCRGVVHPIAGEGSLVCINDDVAPDIFEEQSWIKIDDKNGVWLGFDKDPAKRPGPEDLRRREMELEGTPVELGDGNKWTIPIVRSPLGQTALPRVLVMEKGKPRWDIKAEYRLLFEKALEIKDAVFGTRENNFDESELMWIGTQALAVHYRVGPYEISALELLDSDNLQQIARAIIDYDNLLKLIDEFNKKKVAALQHGVTLNPGVNGHTATIQPGPK